MSLHEIGADPVGQSILIRVNNPLELVKTQSGKPGSFASKMAALATYGAPQTLTNVVLGKMVEQFKEQLAKNGVDVNVMVVDDTGMRATSGERDIVTGIGLGAVLVGLGWTAWRFGLRPLLGVAA